MTAEERIYMLIKKGYEARASRNSKIGIEIDMVKEIPRRSVDPFGNATGDDWQREKRITISIDPDGGWAEYTN